MNDIISTSGPSDNFKSLFKCRKKIDNSQVTLVYEFFQRILLDKEIVPKILVLKYILEFYDGTEHQKRDYDSAYPIFAAASLFILFARKKDGEQFYKIVQMEDWIDKLLSGTPFLINSSMHLKSLLLGVASNFPRKSMEREISILSFPFSTNRETSA